MLDPFYVGYISINVALVGFDYVLDVLCTDDVLFMVICSLWEAQWPFVVIFMGNFMIWLNFFALEGRYYYYSSAMTFLFFSFCHWDSRHKISALLWEFHWDRSCLLIWYQVEILLVVDLISWFCFLILRWYVGLIITLIARAFCILNDLYWLNFDWCIYTRVL